MVLKTQAAAFAKILVKHFKDDIISVVLFGSVGRGDARPDSDIDMIVVI
jgi:predicted nucleotidyltransferase